MICQHTRCLNTHRGRSEHAFSPHISLTVASVSQAPRKQQPSCVPSEQQEGAGTADSSARAETLPWEMCNGSTQQRNSPRSQPHASDTVATSMFTSGKIKLKDVQTKNWQDTAIYHHCHSQQPGFTLWVPYSSSCKSYINTRGRGHACCSFTPMSLTNWNPQEHCKGLKKEKETKEISLPSRETVPGISFPPKSIQWEHCAPSGTSSTALRENKKLV